MTFADEVDAQIKSQGGSCKMCLILESMNSEDRIDIQTVLSDDSFPSAPVQRALKARGIEIGVTTLKKHRVNCDIS